MKYYFVIIKLAITFTFLFLAYSVVKVDDISSILLNINKYWLLLAFLFNIFAIVLSSIRWHFINLKAKLNVPLTSCIKINFSGTFLSQFIVGGGYGGDIYRFFSLVNITKKKKKSVISLLIDRVSGLLSIIFVIFLTLPFYFLYVENKLDFINENISLYLSLIFIFIILILISFFYRHSVLQKIINNIVKKLNLRFFYDDILIWFCKFEYLLIHINTSVLIQFILIMSFVFIGFSINYEMPVIYYFIFSPFIFLAKAIPISFAGWGSREIAAIYLFGSITGDLSGAASISIISGFLLIISSIPGLFFLANSLFKYQRKH